MKKVNFGTKRTILPIIIGLIVILSISCLSASVQAQDGNDIDILYLNGSDSEDPLLKSLELDPKFSIDTNDLELQSAATGNDLLDKYDILILVDPVLSAPNITKINQFVSLGGGLIYVCGENQADHAAQLVSLDIIDSTGETIIKNNQEEAIPTTNNTGNSIYETIDWNSQPEVANYTVFPTPISQLGSNIIVDISKIPVEGSTTQETHPIFIHTERGLGFIIVSTPWLADEALQSQHLWPYFNYLMYSFVMNAAQLDPLSYADWQYSPVPHLLEKVLWSCLVAGLVILTIFIYKRQKKRSKISIDTELLEKLAEENEEEESEINEEAAQHVSDENIDVHVSKMDKSENLLVTEETRLMKDDEIDEWEEIGYHRQLSGFIFALFMSLILLGPQVLLTLYVYPNYIMPFPQAAGYYSFVLRFFEAFWLVLDFGTSTAAAKYFAQYRVKQPKKAIKYIQIYTWWQFLSGIGQFAVVSVIGLYIFPATKYAHMSWFFILHSMIQYPGFLAVFLFFFQGLQRVDKAQLLEILKTVVFNFLFQYVMVLVCRSIFSQITQFGEVFGAVVGLALGSWMSEFVFFGFSYKMFKNLGFSGESIIRIDFGKDELKESFKFGVRLVLGNVWVPLVWFLQVILLSIHVTDYSSEMAYFDLAMTISQVMALVGLYLNGMMPSISEAYGNDKTKLLNLGIVEMLRIMNWLTFAVGAILMVIGNRIIIGFSGPSWSRATLYFVGLLIHAIMGPLSWSGDRIFQGTGRTDLNLYAWILEQSVRAIGAIVLIPMIGMQGVMIAYNLALFSKDIFVWILIRRIIWKGKVYPWKTVVAPIISAVILYIILEGIAQLIWQLDLLTTIIVVLFSVFGGVYISAFLNGFFGLWDDNNLKEFKKATGMVKTVGFMARGLYRTAEFGAKTLKSPFHKKSPIDIYDEAMEEAKTLTHEKRVLDI